MTVFTPPQQPLPQRRNAALALMGAALLASAAWTPAQAQIQRWVDERGRVHYSDAPPPPQARPAGAVTAVEPAPPLSPADQASAAARLQQYRDALAQRPQPPASAAAPSGMASAPAADDQSCAAQWARYNAAYACVDPYRLNHGGIRPEAFDKCPVLAQPGCAPPGSP